ncbi:hypothetical protein IPV09_11110 [Tessaracoccus sp. SD287]|uniref:DUF6270 domain-containing protein n=1 Tax=Tessaracoccus sp. SD287 TaxID=2782008 RepID=UPI001A96E564|nr:DUF6270 domain-containing protein [Tessaracoccus sp. SD287]MBO1031883.1 hypothetical protein [Tessaracoccus sp. SD287]
MDGQARVAILGSCVSRDAFEFADTSWVLTKYMARSSLASFCGRQTDVELPPYTNIASTFQRRMVIEDVEKRGRRWLADKDFDWLIYDPIDERFTLADFEDGGVLTVSQEFTRLELSPARYRQTQFPSDEHFERWVAGWETFMKLLDGYGVRDRLIIHRAKWVQRVQGSDQLTTEPDVIARANDWLERAFTKMADDIPAERFISVSDEHQLADANHRWGISPFHYVEGYYLEFLEKLAAVTSAK